MYINGQNKGAMMLLLSNESISSMDAIQKLL